MAKPLHLQVLTPADILLDIEEAKWVQARLADGCGLGIYPGHAPLLAETVTAPLRYADASGEHAFDVEAGILEIDRDSVTVYTSGPAQPSEIAEAADQEEAKFDRLAQELLARLKDEPEEILDRS